MLLLLLLLLYWRSKVLLWWRWLLPLPPRLSSPTAVWVLVSVSVSGGCGCCCCWWLYLCAAVALCVCISLPWVRVLLLCVCVSMYICVYVCVILHFTGFIQCLIFCFMPAPTQMSPFSAIAVSCRSHGANSWRWWQRRRRRICDLNMVTCSAPAAAISSHTPSLCLSLGFVLLLFLPAARQ